MHKRNQFHLTIVPTYLTYYSTYSTSVLSYSIAVIKYNTTVSHHQFLDLRCFLAAVHLMVATWDCGEFRPPEYGGECRPL